MVICYSKKSPVFVFDKYEIFGGYPRGYDVFWCGNFARRFYSLDDAIDDVISRSSDEYYLNLACWRYFYD